MFFRLSLPQESPAPFNALMAGCLAFSLLLHLLLGLGLHQLPAPTTPAPPAPLEVALETIAIQPAQPKPISPRPPAARVQPPIPAPLPTPVAPPHLPPSLAPEPTQPSPAPAPVAPVVSKPVESPAPPVMQTTPRVETPNTPAPVVEEVQPLFRLTQLPRFSQKIEPIYPVSERSTGTQASVLVEVTLNTRGEVVNIRILKSGGARFDEAVKTALQQSQFSPGMIGNRAVGTRINIPFRFSLN